MATVIVSTSETTSQNLADGDTLVVSEFGSVLASSGDGIFNTGTSGTVQLFGSVYGAVTGLDLGSASTDSFNIHIGTGVRVVGISDYGLDLNGSVHVTNFGDIYGEVRAIKATGALEMSNAGTISSNGLYTIFLDSFFGEVNSHQIANSGSIIGAVDGLLMRNSDLLLTNSGTISGSREGFGTFQVDGLVAGDTTVRVNNSGTIEGGDTGIGTGNSSTDYEHYLEVVNSGTISGGFVSFGIPAGLSQGQTNDTLQNSGEMLGDIRLGSGDDALFNSGTILGDIHKSSGALSITNTGLIDGDLDVSGATFGSLVVTNTGTITGDVAIAPQGSFDGRGGTVLGSINGSIWDDTILLGDTDSTATGNTGNDLIGGGAGDDSMSGGADADTLKGAQGEDTLLGEDGDDVLRGQDGSDSIDGGADNDSLQGGSGDDTLIGDAGFDTLYGNGGDDLMEGGGRSDLMVGGKGNDTMTGGGGGDTFVIRRVGNGDDEVTDFQNGLDVVDISALGVQNFNALNNSFGALSEDTDGVVIDLEAAGGSGSIRLVGVTLADMDASDFIF